MQAVVTATASDVYFSFGGVLTRVEPYVVFVVVTGSAAAALKYCTAHVCLFLLSFPGFLSVFLAGRFHGTLVDNRFLELVLSCIGHVLELRIEAKVTTGRPPVLLQRPSTKVKSVKEPSVPEVFPLFVRSLLGPHLVFHVSGCTPVSSLVSEVTAASPTERDSTWRCCQWFCVACQHGGCYAIRTWSFWCRRVNKP